MNRVFSRLPLRRCLAALGVALVVLSWTDAMAQQRPAAARPSWMPVYEPSLGEEMTAAERAVAMATMDDIERILRQVPELANPRGFTVGKQIYGGTHHLGDRAVFAYAFILWFFPPGSDASHGHGSRCIGVQVNNFGLSDGRPLVDEAGRYLFVERDIGDAMPQATLVQEGLRWDTPTADGRNGYVIYTARGAFAWLPVTREQYLRAQIFDAEGKGGQLEKEFKDALRTSSYEQWMQGAAERRTNREAAVAAMLRAQGRAAADELRQTLEQSEREATAGLKEAEAEEREQRKSALDNRYGDMLRAQITAMTPAERASPATAGPDGVLVAPTDREAHRVLTPDPGFWRVRRSRAEAHSITVAMGHTLVCADPAVRSALAKTYQTLDGAAFRKLLDLP